MLFEDGCDFVCDVVSSGVGSVLDLAVPGVEGHVRDDSLVVGVDDAANDVPPWRRFSKAPIVDDDASISTTESTPASSSFLSGSHTSV